MNKCEICGKEYMAFRVTSRYCSPKCKQASYRNKGVTVTDDSVTQPVSVTSPDIAQSTQEPTHEVSSGSSKPEQLLSQHQASLSHYHSNPDMYVTRREPDKMNWGTNCTSVVLAKAGLRCNRVSIPGDHDYSGVVVV